MLFRKVETAEALKRLEDEAAAKKAAAAKAKAAAKSSEGSTLSKVDLRVGRVLAVEKHPQADALYVEDIDLGGEKPRKVVFRSPLTSQRAVREIAACSLWFVSMSLLML